MAGEITLKSFPFDSMNVLNTESSQMEPDRLYAAEIFRKYFAKFLSNGVYFGNYKNYGENSMKVTADGGLNIRVAKGAGLIEGADFENEQERVFTLERPVSGNRVDRVVVKFDTTLAVRETQIYVKSGTGETPALLQRDENIYEICLAEVTVKANDGTPNFNVAATTNEGIFAAEDDLGTSYYFRGAVENNYVKFAGFYWRIIRINGDGTIRMIYDGTSAHANGEESEDRQVGITVFNTNYDDNAYVGYMYETPASSTYETTHANINDSTIKTANDAWYKTNIQDKGYGDYVADAIYCSDRQVVSFPEMGLTGNGIGTQNTAYGFFGRFSLSEEGMPTNFTPSLKCAQENDRFTTTTSLGNGDLTYPVGLLTADEVNMAGAIVDVNYSYYLYTGDYYWLFSPIGFDSGNAYVWDVRVVGDLDADYVGFSGGLRPVISLKSNIGFSRNGTMNNPFEIS